MACFDQLIDRKRLWLFVGGSFRFSHTTTWLRAEGMNLRAPPRNNVLTALPRAVCSLGSRCGLRHRLQTQHLRMLNSCNHVCVLPELPLIYYFTRMSCRCLCSICLALTLPQRCWGMKTWICVSFTWNNVAHHTQEFSLNTQDFSANTHTHTRRIAHSPHTGFLTHHTL